MNNYRIEYDVDYSALANFLRTIPQEIEGGSELVQSIQRGGNYLAQTWIDISANHFQHSSGGYARGIAEGVKYPFENDPLRYAIIHTKEYAYYLEHGYESFDMKKMLWTSDKVRISKKGKRYIHIPFRHGTPGSVSMNAMPESVYSSAKNLRQSVVTGTYREGSVRKAVGSGDADLLRRHNPQKVTRRVYSWGERFEGGGKYSGMVRFDANVGKVRLGKFSGKNSGGSDYSIYMTFRTMSEDSKGWIHPGQAGMKILESTVKKVETPILNDIANAVESDLRKLGLS